MGNSIKALFMLASLLASPAVFAEKAPSSYEECLESHRQGLEDRHYTSKCKGSKASECQKQYGEDYLKDVAICREKFNKTDSVMTYPTDNSALDCSSESRSDMQALGESCQSLGQSTTSRCDPSQAQKIISMASQKSTGNMQASGASTTNACQQAGQFNQEAGTALQSFQATCEPAITEGQAVCDRARSIISRSQCSGSQKTQYVSLVEQGTASFSQHRATLSDAQRSVQAAQNGQADAAKCASQAAAATNESPKKDDAAKASDSTDTAAAASSTTTAVPPPGGSGGETVGANSVGDPSAMSSLSRSNAEENGGNRLWDLPTTGASGDPAAGTAGSDLGVAKSKDDASAGGKSGAAKAAGAKAGSSSLASGGKGARGLKALNLGKLGEADANRLPASAAGAEGNPDLSAFLPGCIPRPKTDGLTGPECGQWQKIHVRYGELLDGSEP